MQILITNILLLTIAGGIGYLVAQERPQWFGPEIRQRLFFLGWIIALLLAGAMRAAAIVYGPGAMFSLLSLIIGFGLGIWLGLRLADPDRPRGR
ncbi:hypothetical protein [Candidatus Viridilinea mediisalina]|uniref:Uncharacterized protein n=1 Tax=Candidatus Viridilinea mediisalina TaxID=2024553 RepID=A0A2A6RG34_9CHLR|nr:hypothetical protein [Candidatus Viridilinea mediisalina]PDW01903.1 hypothetical protein CJ255_16710 [Candidatus Viridilinea mediisalina]